MLPRWHIFFGAIFTILIWLFSPETNLIYLSLIFFSSFLIDFDHYINAVKKNKSLSLKKAFVYHDNLAKNHENQKKKGTRKKGDFHLFHTIEFHILIGIIGFFFTPFFYIFIGMIFHSLLDVISLLHEDAFYQREYFFFNWVRNLNFK